MAFKIYYKDKSIVAISKKKMNYDFIINDNLSMDFINGNKNPSEYKIENYYNKFEILKIEDINFIEINDGLQLISENFISNGIKIILYEFLNSFSIELTNKNKNYYIKNGILNIYFENNDEIIHKISIELNDLYKQKKYVYKNIDIKNISSIRTSNCSLNVFYHKTKKRSMLTINGLLDNEINYSNLEDNDVEIQLYKNKNQYSISVIMKNNIIPNIDITNWIIGIVDKHDKNKLYHWFNVPIDILLEKKQYHTGFISDKNLKNSILIGRNIFDKIGVQWK